MQAALERLHPLRPVVLPLLRERFQAAVLDSGQQLHFAFALAALGIVEEDFLLRRTTTIPPSEARNMLRALTPATTAVLPKLRQRLAGEENPELQARLAIFLWQLGDPAGMEQVLALAADPMPRTALIHSFGTWAVSLQALPDLLRGNHDPALQSGICAAVGLLDPASLSPSERGAFVEVLEYLYRETPDSGVHSAAGWALGRWHQDLPAIKASKQAPSQRGWFVNSHGMTMLVVQPGTFAMGDLSPEQPAVRTVTIAHRYFLSDREVSVALFRQFRADPSYPAEEPGKSKWIDRGYGEDCAVGAVSWTEAVLFCNWLSHKEKREPCYSSFSRPTMENQRGTITWTWDIKANGYRLPTESEWEFACRARSQTPYSFGDDSERLVHYAYFNMNSGGRTRPRGQKLPNGWGFFDMHGNVAEWCWVDRDLSTANALKAPPVSTGRAPYRGGGFFTDAGEARSGRTPEPLEVHGRYPHVGFRVLCSGDGSL